MTGSLVTRALPSPFAERVSGARTPISQSYPMRVRARTENGNLVATAKGEIGRGRHLELRIPLLMLRNVITDDSRSFAFGSSICADLEKGQLVLDDSLPRDAADKLATALRRDIEHAREFGLGNKQVEIKGPPPRQRTRPIIAAIAYLVPLPAWIPATFFISKETRIAGAAMSADLFVGIVLMLWRPRWTPSVMAALMSASALAFVADAVRGGVYLALVGTVYCLASAIVIKRTTRGGAHLTRFDTSRPEIAPEADPPPKHFPPPPEGRKRITVRCAENADEEGQVRDELLHLLSRYDTSPWTFTTEVEIDRRAVPHSHPVLTLNTFNRGYFLLASYLHEQLHWYAEEHSVAAMRCVDWTKSRYPDAPVGLPEGAHDEFSTYLHLVVNWLEVGALRALLGAEYAGELVGRMIEKGVYRWVYRQVLADFDEMTREYGSRGLLPPVAPTVDGY